MNLFIHQQALDTTTPAGKAMFQMLGVFSELERSVIQARVMAELDRAHAAGVRLGRKPTPAKVEAAIRQRLSAGIGMLKIAAELQVAVARFSGSSGR